MVQANNFITKRKRSINFGGHETGFNEEAAIAARVAEAGAEMTQEAATAEVRSDAIPTGACKPASGTNADCTTP